MSATVPQRRWMILGALWLFILIVLLFFRSVVMPFAGAALVAFLMAPAVDRISSWKIAHRAVPRWVAILTLYTLFFVAVYLMFIAVVPQLYAELVRITRQTLVSANSLTPERIHELAAEAEGWLRQRGIPVDVGGAPPEAGQFSIPVDLERLLRDTIHQTTQWVRLHAGDIVALSRKFVTGMLAMLFMLFFILMVAAFFSIDVRGIRSYVKTLVPPEFTEDVKLLAARIDRSLAGVVRGQVTIRLVNGVLTLAGLLLFDINFAFLLATIATVLSLIPIFGAILSSVPIIAIALTQGWEKAVAMLLWIVGIHALEAYFLNPKIMGSAARIHPIVVAFALIAGERTYGLVGALFAVPLAAILVACFEYARLKAQPEEGPAKPA